MSPRVRLYVSVYACVRTYEAYALQARGRDLQSPERLPESDNVRHVKHRGARMH